MPHIGQIGLISISYLILYTVSASNEHTIGLKSDGTVVAVGYNYWGQCDITEWKDIVAVSAGSISTVGVKSNGTVVATKPYARKSLVNTILGYNSPQPDFGQSEVQGWTDIVAISAVGLHTVGITSGELLPK